MNGNLTAEESLKNLQDSIRRLHVKQEDIQCGAMASVEHRHGRDVDKGPHPVRPVVCTMEQGHLENEGDGEHRDTICCYNFQRFSEDDVTGYKPMKWKDRSYCIHCNATWPCATISLLLENTANVDIEPDLNVMQSVARRMSGPCTETQSS